MPRVAYTPFQSTPTPADPTSGIWIPMITVTFRGDLDEIKLACLADTGAIETILPDEFKDALGARPVAGESTMEVGNRGKMTLTYGMVELGISLDGNEYRWRAVVGFSKERDEPVLGDAGFFRYFGVYFRRREKYMLVYPPVGLPSPGLE